MAERTAPPAPYRREHHARLGSTNEVALEALLDGGPGGLWVTADEQLAGRGRRGRLWVSPPGNLYASLALLKPGPHSVAATLSFVAALALHRSVADLAGPAVAERLQLKWPNDLLVDRFKVAGILLERATRSDGTEAIVIGIGVNCRHHPETVSGHPASSLAERGIPVDSEALFGRLAANIADDIRSWDEGRGFAAIRSAWLARSFGVGEPITVRLTGQALEGRFEALDEDGRLVLLDGDGRRRTVSAGEVFFARAGG